MFKFLLVLQTLLHFSTARFFINFASQKCLRDAGTMRLEECSMLTDQDWTLKSDGTLVNTYTTKCLDANGKNLYPVKCSDGKHIKWTLTNGMLKNNDLKTCVHPENPYVPELTECSTEKGDQRWLQRTSRIFVNDASGRCLEDSTSAAARLEVCNLAGRQSWQLRTDGRIYNIGTQRCLSATENSVYGDKCGDSGKNQIWTFTNNLELKNYGLNKCLYPENMYVANLADCNNKEEQQWQPKTLIGRFFVSQANRRCLTDSRSEARTEVCTLTSDQEWDLTYQGKIVNKYTGLCLNAAKTDDGKGFVYTYDCATTIKTDQVNSAWTITQYGQLKNSGLKKCIHPKSKYTTEFVTCNNDAKDQKYDSSLTRVFVNSDSKKCLEDGGGNGRIETCAESDAQKWVLMPVGQIKNKKTGRCLDGKDKNVFTEICGKDKNQAYTLSEEGQIKNYYLGTCVYPENPYVPGLTSCDSNKADQLWLEK